MSWCQAHRILKHMLWVRIEAVNDFITPSKCLHMFTQKMHTVLYFIAPHRLTFMSSNRHDMMDWCFTLCTMCRHTFHKLARYARNKSRAWKCRTSLWFHVWFFMGSLLSVWDEVMTPRLSHIETSAPIIAPSLAKLGSFIVRTSLSRSKSHILRFINYQIIATVRCTNYCKDTIHATTHSKSNALHNAGLSWQSLPSAAGLESSSNVTASWPYNWRQPPMTRQRASYAGATYKQMNGKWHEVRGHILRTRHAFCCARSWHTMSFLTTFKSRWFAFGC